MITLPRVLPTYEVEQAQDGRCQVLVVRGELRVVVRRGLPREEADRLAAEFAERTAALNAV